MSDANPSNPLPFIDTARLPTTPPPGRRGIYHVPPHRTALRNKNCVWYLRISCIVSPEFTAYQTVYTRKSERPLSSLATASRLED